MRARFRRHVAALALLAGCEGVGTGTNVCPAMPAPSLLVEVVDAASGTSLNAGASGWWISGDYRGRLERNVIEPSQELAAFGPSGRYSLIVQHAGYAVWGRDDLRVRRGECGPHTLRVRVELSANHLRSVEAAPAD